MRSSRVLWAALVVGSPSCFADPPVAGEADDDGGTASDDGDGTGTGGSSSSPSSTTTSSMTASSAATDDTGSRPSDCGPAQECVAAAPPDWNGPVLVAIASGADAPLGCPPMSEGRDVLVRAPPPGMPECACECGDPVDVACDETGGSISGDPTAGATCDTVASVPAFSTGCFEAPAIWHAVSFGPSPIADGVGGSCDPTPVPSRTRHACRSSTCFPTTCA